MMRFAAPIFLVFQCHAVVSFTFTSENRLIRKSFGAKLPSVSTLPPKAAYLRHKFLLRSGSKDLPKSMAENDRSINTNTAFNTLHDDDIRQMTFGEDPYLNERDGCGVGFIARLHDYRSNTPINNVQHSMSGFYQSPELDYDFEGTIPEPIKTSTKGSDGGTHKMAVDNRGGGSQYRVMEMALRALSCMEHRGACSGSLSDSGDGSGIMSSIPWKMLAAELRSPSPSPSPAAAAAADHDHTAPPRGSGAGHWYTVNRETTTSTASSSSSSSSSSAYNTGRLDPALSASLAQSMEYKHQMAIPDGGSHTLDNDGLVNPKPVLGGGGGQEGEAGGERELLELGVGMFFLPRQGDSQGDSGATTAATASTTATNCASSPSSLALAAQFYIGAHTNNIKIDPTTLLPTLNGNGMENTMETNSPDGSASASTYTYRLEVLGWRDVPLGVEVGGSNGVAEKGPVPGPGLGLGAVLGEGAEANRPHIAQCLIGLVRYRHSKNSQDSTDSSDKNESSSSSDLTARALSDRFETILYAFRRSLVPFVELSLDEDEGEEGEGGEEERSEMAATGTEGTDTESSSSSSSSSSGSGDASSPRRLIRRISANEPVEEGSGEVYACSLSGRTIVYKAMCKSSALGWLYPDLRHPLFDTMYAIYHRRFSTNTMPRWPLAQPMRMLGHNGEINTLLGNLNWARAKTSTEARDGTSTSTSTTTTSSPSSLNSSSSSSLAGLALAEEPIVNSDRSDSYNLDKVFERLVKGTTANTANTANIADITTAADTDTVESGAMLGDYERSCEEALMMLVPEAYRNHPSLPDNGDIPSFYKFYEGVQEAWDGPALLVYSDGKHVGACLDRNGLRPARYLRTVDGLVCMMSETGVVGNSGTTAAYREGGNTAADGRGEAEDEDGIHGDYFGVSDGMVAEKGRLGPGQMIAVDLTTGKFMHNWEVKRSVATKFPYQKWLQENRVELKQTSFGQEVSAFDASSGSGDSKEEEDAEGLLPLQVAFGWGSEDVEMQIRAMALQGAEPTFCMGDDAPLAVLSRYPHTTYDYLKQRFAQVTNPPIDPLREGAVMALDMYLGSKERSGTHLGGISSVWSEGPHPSLARLIHIEGPVIGQEEMDYILQNSNGENDNNKNSSPFPSQVLDTTYHSSTDTSTGTNLREAIKALCSKAVEAVRGGAEIIVLSDKPFDDKLREAASAASFAAAAGKDGELPPPPSYIPPLLAVGATHHALIKAGLRQYASLVVETGQAWGTHHYACLVGYGASAVHPYLAYRAVLKELTNKRVINFQKTGKLPKGVTPEMALANYRKSAENGLKKILSKMGISMLSSYQGAQIFEAIGLGKEVVDGMADSDDSDDSDDSNSSAPGSLVGTPSRVGGLSYNDLEGEVQMFINQVLAEAAAAGAAETAEEEEEPGRAGSSPLGSPSGSPYASLKKLPNYGFVQYMPSAEHHDNTGKMSKALHSAVREPNDGTAPPLTAEEIKAAEEKEQEEEEKLVIGRQGPSFHLPPTMGNPRGVAGYNEFRSILSKKPPTTIRDLVDLRLPSSDDGEDGEEAEAGGEYVPGRRPVPIEEVESEAEIMSRFCTGGMSLGALSREAHETLAVAMNRIGGKSNSGEGGEDPLRFEPILDVEEAASGESVSKSFPHLKGLRTGDIARSKIKQVASGRFGVTPHYLASADQLEIKVAQGAKPGEGGQLPGPKIDDYIANLRSSKPGVTLISPPPHHDIYSIEDLAQLIYDLHTVNPKALVSVKLVSEVGIGTIAAGVAKANADVIQISGHDGGTGASPLSSIKHAGGPWELGLSEAHQTLVKNDLREKVLLRVDGGIKTGWDVVVAAALGAEEYGFGTIAMIAEGCVMARICHTNGCPVGVTSQKEELRKKFPGTPDHVVNYFQFVAAEVRTLLSQMGYKSLGEIVGCSTNVGGRFLTKNVLQYRQDVAIPKMKTATAGPAGTDNGNSVVPTLDLSALGVHHRRSDDDGNSGKKESPGRQYSYNRHPRRRTAHPVPGPAHYDEALLGHAPMKTILDGLLGRMKKGEGKEGEKEQRQQQEQQKEEEEQQLKALQELRQRRWPIYNTDRSVLARLSGTIAKSYGGNQALKALPLPLPSTQQSQPQYLPLRFVGSAGQSFASFVLPYMEIDLVGEANDYVGKGMHGGRLIVRPPPLATTTTASSSSSTSSSSSSKGRGVGTGTGTATGRAYTAEDNVIVGNTCFYGGTGGHAFINGRAGERFGVRNSGVTCVVEGLGDHACEYMTGGVVVCLGPAGRNIAAGMTGGVAYFLDDGGEHMCAFLDDATDCAIDGDTTSGSGSGGVSGCGYNLPNRVNRGTGVAVRKIVDYVPSSSSADAGATGNSNSDSNGDGQGQARDNLESESEFVVVRNEAAIAQLRSLLEDHVEYTGSRRAREILRRWDEFLPKFYQIVPPAEAKAGLKVAGPLLAEGSQLDTATTAAAGASPTSAATATAP